MFRLNHGLHLASQLLLMGCTWGCSSSEASDPDSCETDCPAVCKKPDDCDDGVFCNGPENCDPSSQKANKQGCVPGVPIRCNDDVDCTRDACDEVNHQCLYLARDADNDGHRDASCRDRNGSPLGDDCADEDADVYPGQPEKCTSPEDETRDEDCDVATLGERDEDQDTFVSSACCNGSNCGPDCDDGNYDVRPQGHEYCDELDNDCDGKVDEDSNHLIAQYLDEDGDHFGLNADAVNDCKKLKNRSASAGDCDDQDASIHPAASEVCGDDMDNNCNELVDEGLLCESNGTPVCAAGQSSCGPDCADLNRDRKHCGRCDSPCQKDEVCELGRCISDVCPSGTYRIELNGLSSCVAFTRCQPGQYVVQAGTPTTDLICQVCPSQKYSSTYDAETCTAWTPCLPGFHVSAAPTPEQDSACEPCPAGTSSAGGVVTDCTALDRWLISPDEGPDQLADIDVDAAGRLFIAGTTTLSATGVLGGVRSAAFVAELASSEARWLTNWQEQVLDSTALAVTASTLGATLVFTSQSLVNSYYATTLSPNSVSASPAGEETCYPRSSATVTYLASTLDSSGDPMFVCQSEAQLSVQKGYNQIADVPNAIYLPQISPRPSPDGTTWVAGKLDPSSVAITLGTLDDGLLPDAPQIAVGNYAEALAITVNSQGQVFLLGRTGDSSSSILRPFLVSLNSDLKRRWIVLFGPDEFDTVSEIAVDGAENVFVLGQRRNTSWLYQIGPSGTLGGKVHLSDRTGFALKYLAVDAGGDAYVAGTAGGDIYVLRVPGNP